MSVDTLPQKVESQAIVKEYVQRVRGGDLGALPAIFGLVVLVGVFSVLRPIFFSPGNFANLLTQGAVYVVIAMGLIFVLLLGEIDLSAGFASGVCAVVMSVTLVNVGVPWYVAILAAMATGVVIGLILGSLVAKLGIPSFVVTLAAFIAFQGVVLLILGQGNIISVRDQTIFAISNKNLPPWLGWGLAAAAVAGYAAVQLVQARNRSKRGLAIAPPLVIGGRVAAVALVIGLAVYVLNLDRGRAIPLMGVPIVVPVILFFLLLWTFVLRRTAFGRHIYAVGGNAEAARRAGIPVDRIKIACFVICSFMASVGGVLAVSRAASVDPNTGGSNVLLFSVGAAVIGGTSLFGGKGRALDAILGGAVVAVVENGMGLMGYGSGQKFVVTGSVLLLAASVDALSRKRAAATGHR